MMIITQALIWPYLYYVAIPMVGTASSNSMLYQLEGVNGKDLKVKAHPSWTGIFKTGFFGLEINYKEIHFSLCIIVIF